MQIWSSKKTDEPFMPPRSVAIPWRSIQTLRLVAPMDNTLPTFVDRIFQHRHLALPSEKSQSPCALMDDINLAARKPTCTARTTTLRFL